MAEALSLMFAGAMYVALLVGVVRLTVGALLPVKK